MGDAKNEDEVAAENWDDEGGHLATRRRKIVRDDLDEALQERWEEEGDVEPPATVPLLTGTPRSREPQRIAHFPPLR
ncbi:hypothetical protein [Microbacterium enclense]|uniref:hypothetical protein n=1 Tax=Microbacterium enclense TaxID=993073 RepID=UPI00341DD9BC